MPYNITLLPSNNEFSAANHYLVIINTFVVIDDNVALDIDDGDFVTTCHISKITCQYSVF